MKKILFMVLIAVILFTAGCVSNPQSGEGIVITNSDGTKVVLNSTAERIVLLNSNAGEILYLLGDADKIVGISQSIANNAEQAKMYSNAVVVGTWNEPDVEYLISLKADIVVGYATSKPKN
ncbi:MAG: ABC transporter substrate-binding protein, partial [Methanocorpusculum sp.]|nr:ABC transporter substrate-binding protein [Methanocorpusculum sp.]